MYMCDCLHSVIPKKSYTNTVIAGKVMSPAVNHKKRENGMIPQFLPVPVGNSIRHG